METDFEKFLKKYESMRRELEILRSRYADQAEEIRSLKIGFDENDRRARMAINANMRVTKLIRRTLPEELHQGCGLDGMVETLLAEVARARMPKQEAPGED